MSDLIRNIKDPNFKSLLKKLLDSEWLEKLVDTTATARARRNIEFVWSFKGQLCLTTIKAQMRESPFWGETKAFLASLNEQEEAFFHENILSAVGPHQSS